MIKRLRIKFVAVIMGASAFILLAVFIVLLISTATGLRRQSMDALERALNISGHQDNRGDQPGGGGKNIQENEGTPVMPRRPDDRQPLSGRFPSFTALVDSRGNVTLQEKDFFLQDEYETSEIKELALTAAGSPEERGAMASYRLLYAKRATEEDVLVAFVDTSQEITAMSQLIKSSLVVGIATLLVFFAASILLARWAVKPVEAAWLRQKQFVGDASHELKTPLTVILSNADMMLNHPGENQRKWAENIKAEAIRMKELTQELLALARSDGEDRRPVLEKVDFSYLVTDSILSFEPVIYETGHTLSYQVAEGLFLMGDPSALSRLVGILLDNAVKYGSPGGAVTAALETQGKWISLCVSNTGAPIHEEELTKIFERFYRGDPSRCGGGHGLGLSIARSVVQAHKGKIWAESKNGLNSFTVLLPNFKQ